MSMDHIDNKSIWDRWHLTTCNYLNQCLLCSVIAYVLHRHQWVGICCNFTLASHIIHYCEQDDTSLAIYYSTKFRQLIFTMSMSKGLCQMAVMKAVVFKSALMCSDIGIISIRYQPSLLPYLTTDDDIFKWKCFSHTAHPFCGKSTGDQCIPLTKGYI